MTMKAHFEYLVTSTIEEINKAIKNAASSDNNYGAKGEFCDIIMAYALSYFSTNSAKADIAFTGIKTNYPERFDYMVSLKDDMRKIQTQIDEINSLPRQDKTAKTKLKNELTNIKFDILCFKYFCKKSYNRVFDLSADILEIDLAGYLQKIKADINFNNAEISNERGGGLLRLPCQSRACNR